MLKPGRHQIAYGAVWDHTNIRGAVVASGCGYTETGCDAVYWIGICM